MSNATKKNDTVSNLKESAHELQVDLNYAANKAGRRARRLFNSASAEFNEASEMVTGEIRSNPVRSSAIALGVGVLIGTILRPSRQAK